MAIKGSLKEASLPDVLQLLALGQTVIEFLVDCHGVTLLGCLPG